MGNPTGLYVSLMEQLDLRRRKLRWPMWKLDDLSGVNDGYFAKALHADAPSGRQAGWQMLDYLITALYPRGCRVKVIPCRKRRMLETPSMNGGNGRHIEQSKIILPQRVRLWLKGQARARGKKGAAARNRQLTPQQRSQLARKAAVIRWTAVKEAVKRRRRRRGRPRRAS
jgi:hypothetical protein